MPPHPVPGPRVSIVVPAHNEAILLPDCLRALLSQDYLGELEIIVVDNGSMDGTGEIARAAGVRVIEEPRRGYASALRRGFAAATGDIVASTDADSMAPPDWVSRLVRAYEHEDVVAAGGDVEYLKPNWKGWLFTRCLLPRLVRNDRRCEAGPHLWGANFSVRRDVFLRAGGFHPDFNMQVDTELSERLRAFGRVVVIEGAPIQTSCRRWNRSLLLSMFLFGSNFLWLKFFSKPLWQWFPDVREPLPSPGASFRAWQPRLAAICVAVAVTVPAGVLGYDAFAPWSNAFGGTTVWYGPPAQKVVALTFDDGPDEPYTSEVLDILRREHVKATFFLIGTNVRLYPETAARIAHEGHAIGNHTDTHPFLLALGPEDEIEGEVDRAERTIHSVTGIYPHLFRPPQGIRSPWMMQVLQADSLLAVTWDDAPRDWERRSAGDLYKRTLHEASPGAIVLLHDGLNLDHHADRTETVRALPRIIHSLRAMGYSFVTVPELLRQPLALAQWGGPEGAARAKQVRQAAAPPPPAKAVSPL